MELHYLPAEKRIPQYTDMSEYEIRILKKDGRHLVIRTRLMGDHAAIRRAKTLALQGDRVEVLRGMLCVFSTLEGTIAYQDA